MESWRWYFRVPKVAARARRLCRPYAVSGYIAVTNVRYAGGYAHMEVTS